MAKNIIKINRGDSYEFNVAIPDKTGTAESRNLTDTETIYFALLYPHQRFEEAIFYKGYDCTDHSSTGEIQIKISPNDTMNLAPGIYYYTVKLFNMSSSKLLAEIFSNTDKILEASTIIERTKFIINE
jgi:hypothetical protein